MIKSSFLSFTEKNRISIPFNTVSSKLRKFYGIFINSIFVEIAARCSAKRENTVY